MTGLFLNNQGELYLSFKFLRTRYQVSGNTIESWSKRKSDRIIKLSDGNSAILFDAIPDASKAKYKIESKDDLLLLSTSEKEILDSQIQKLGESLRLTILQDWQNHISTYREKFQENHAFNYSKLHCLYLELFKLRKTIPVKVLFEVVKSMPESPLKIKTYSKFCRKLSDAIDAINKECLPEFVPARYHANDNRLLLEQEHRTILIQLFRKPEKLSRKEIFIRYQYIINNDYGTPTASYNTICRFLRTQFSKTITAEGRYGRKYFEENFAIHTKRSNVRNSFTLCAADGLQLGRAVIFKDKKVGQVTIWIMYDWFSGAILGYSIDRTESFEGIRAGFRDLLKKQNGICPKELVIDTKWVNNSEVKNLFESKAGILLRKKRPYNPRDSKAERFNEIFNTIHRQIDSGWASITNHDKEKVHNPTHLREIRPVTFEEIHHIITDVVNIYNKDRDPLKGKSRYETCLSNISEAPKVFNVLDQVKLFGDNRLVTVKSGYFKIKINSKTYEFEVTDYHKHYDKLENLRLRVYYDQSDMSSVEAFYIKDESNPAHDTYMGACIINKTFNPSKVEQTNEDRQVMQGQMKRAAQLEKKIREAKEKHEELVNTLDIRSSIERAGQDRYKEALSSEVAQLYKQVDEDTMRGKDLQVVEVSEPKQIRNRKNDFKPVDKEEDENYEHYFRRV